MTDLAPFASTLAVVADTHRLLNLIDEALDSAEETAQRPVSQ